MTHSAPSPCMLCGATFPRSKLVRGALVRPLLSERIAARHPDTWRDEGLVCRDCLSRERTAFVLSTLELERGELSAIERDISAKATEHVAIARRVDEHFDSQLTIGGRVADRVADVGGSWPFVLGFIAMLFVWIGVNTWALRDGAFDPYPYILLNLILSCLAALQAPVIMMSQNRVAARDRARAEEDYRINLKAELEVAALHEKIDHLLHIQWERLVEIQQIQLELLEELEQRRARST